MADWRPSAGQAERLLVWSGRSRRSVDQPHLATTDEYAKVCARHDDSLKPQPRQLGMPAACAVHEIPFFPDSLKDMP